MQRALACLPCTSPHAPRPRRACDLTVVITGVVDKWPALGKWSGEYLTQHYGDKLFTCGPVKMSMAHYFRHVP